MHRLLRTFTSKGKPATKSRIVDNSVLSKLPYEVLEVILTYAWHGGFTGLPGCGEFIFDDPRQVASDEYATLNASDIDLEERAKQMILAPLETAPHTKLTTSAWALTNGAGVFPGTEAYTRLALVCMTWHQIMLDLTLEYISLPTLKKFHEYARVLEIDGPPDDILSRVNVRNGKERAVPEAIPLTQRAEKARRLCRALHVDVPTGNLTMVPSWHDIPRIIAPLSSLTHLMLTAAEPHPALLTLLTILPQSITTLDIHISSPFAYKPLVIGSSAPMSTAATIAQTQAEMARREIGKKHSEALRLGVENVRHVLINVIDPILLGSLLEGFGSMEPSSTAGDDEEKKEDSTGLYYASRTLQTVTLQGLHDLTGRAVTHTISHLSTVHTLRLYPHTNRPQLAPHTDSLRWWNAVQALGNEAWFPALERLVIQLPIGYLEQSPELEKIRDACNKRSVRVDVERLS